MNEPIRYCENCGKAIRVQARFCTYCGTQVQPLVETPGQPQYPPPPPPPVYTPPSYQPPPPPVVQPAPQPVASMPAETVMGVIPFARRPKGFLGMGAENYTLVITNLRIIFAKLTSAMMKENVRNANQAAKAQGKGLFGQWGAMFGAQAGQGYLNMQPQAILAEQPGNFFVMNNQVRSVKIRHNQDFEQGTTEYQLHVDASADKIKLIFTRFDERAVRELLRSVLGNVVR